MLRLASKAVLTETLRQVAKLPLTRRAMHALSVAARGPSVVFLRCRRVLPDTAVGRSHIDRRMGGAVLASELEKDLEALAKTLRFVHPGEALAGLEEGRRLEEGAAVLTFDESFAATAECALPILERWRIPALFFVSTGYLEGDQTLWDQVVHTALEQVAPAPLSLPFVDRILRTESAAQRAASVKKLLLTLVPLDPAHLEKRLADLYERLGADPAPPQIDRMLSSAEVSRLAEHPMVSIGAHGHRHLALSSLEEATLEEELGRPREVLRELCGVSFCDVVSYPFGRPPYFDERVIAAARRAGYRAGLTGVPGVARPGDHLFALPRLPLGPKTRAAEAYELQGVSAAVDELLLVATGATDRVVAELEG